MSLYVGDCRDGLRSFIAAGVRAQCCVTSPPYWGLRDYGTAQWAGGDESCDHRKPNADSGHIVHTTLGGGLATNAAQIGGYRGECGKCGATRIDRQLGLDPTIAEYVANMVEVFRLVREVLADDGVLWLNLGDSYATGTSTASKPSPDTDNGYWQKSDAIGRNRIDGATSGLKPKDLCGIPWRVAFALQQPYYTGTIRDERDRIWLAAMLDAEGCMFIHKRKAGQNNGQGYQRQNDSYGPGVEIENTSLPVIERVMALVGKGSICSQSPEQNDRRKQTIYRWNLRTTECRDFVRELYPHLVAKQHQARILCGCPSSGERAEASHEALIGLHRGRATDVDFAEPTTMFEPGWYLRQDVIWKKPNPMPESVTDRCTKAHEYLFLLSKRERYFYDAAAIAEQCTQDEFRPTFRGGAYVDNATFDNADGGRSTVVGNVRRSGNKERKPAGLRGIPAASTTDPNGGVAGSIPWEGSTRNRRSVWTVATQPYAEAHFATFPTALVEPCIMAGSRVGDTVLDPFMGSGTVAQVAQDLGRQWIGCELSPEYAKLIAKRTAQQGMVYA